MTVLVNIRIYSDFGVGLESVLISLSLPDDIHHGYTYENGSKTPMPRLTI